MKILEIKALENGSHRNQEGAFNRIPDGWAVIPEGLELENFPFGEPVIVYPYDEPLVTEENGELIIDNGPAFPTVTGWIPGIVPETPKTPEAPVSEEEKLRADIDYIAAMTGVDL